jgi:CubicO group peptidase (beta-lactamase class C family)
MFQKIFSFVFCTCLVFMANLTKANINSVTPELSPGEIISLMPDNPEIAFPGKAWKLEENIQSFGWNREKLDEAKAYADSIGSYGVMVVDHGHLIADWGATKEDLYVASIRKSVLSALIGIAVEKGQISLESTLAELGIDDNAPGLSPREATATVRHLLQSRSGNFTSGCRLTLRRGSFPRRTCTRHILVLQQLGLQRPGHHYENATGHGIYEQIEQQLAVPLQMESFTKEDGQYQLEKVSIHPAYHFDMSAHDLAALACSISLVDDGGDKQIIPCEWVKESLQPYSEVTNPWTPKGSLGYGYLWYVDHLFNGFSARGGTGQRIAVLPNKA